MDDAMVCPLCRSVLEVDRQIKQKPRMYPVVVQRTKALKLISRIYILAAILCEITLMLVNYYTYRGVKWSLICGGAFLYLFLTLKYSIDNPNAGIRMKLIVQSVGFVLLSVLIDNIIGYRGWSVNYAIPCMIILMDIAIAILMIINIDFWQSYIVMQLFMVFVSIVVIVLSGFHIVSRPVLTYVAAGVSILIFLLTLVLGDSKAREELKRKFHI